MLFFFVVVADDVVPVVSVYRGTKTEYFLTTLCLFKNRFASFLKKVFKGLFYENLFFSALFFSIFVAYLHACQLTQQVQKMTASTLLDRLVLTLTVTPYVETRCLDFA